MSNDSTESRARAGSRRSVRTTDPLARAIFSQLRDCTETDRRFVYDALCAADRGMGPERLQLMQDAVSRFHLVTGKSPSYRAYEAWRKAAADPGLPTASSIVRAFNGWTQAMAAAGVRPAPEVRAVGMLARGRAMSNDELLAALRACAEDLGKRRISYGEYRAWAKRELSKKQPSLNGAIPISRSTFGRFGSFARALLAAGLVDRAEAGIRTVPRYSDQQLIDALLAAPKDLEGNLTMASYESWRREQNANRAAGRQSSLPGGEAISVRFGSWVDALVRAGLISRSESEMGTRLGGGGLSLQVISTHLLAAVRELGTPMKQLAYRRWRDRQPRALGRPLPPGDGAIAARFQGGWAAAVEAATKSLDALDPVGDLASKVRDG